MALLKKSCENKVKFFEKSLKVAILDKNFGIKIEGFKSPGNYAAELFLCILENALDRKIKAFLFILNLRGNTCHLREQLCTLFFQK